MGQQGDKGSLLERQAKDTTRSSDSSKDNFQGRFLANKSPQKRLSGGITENLPFIEIKWHQKLKVPFVINIKLLISKVLVALQRDLPSTMDPCLPPFSIKHTDIISPIVTLKRLWASKTCFRSEVRQASPLVSVKRTKITKPDEQTNAHLFSLKTREPPGKLDLKRRPRLSLGGGPAMLQLSPCIFTLRSGGS